MATIYNSDLTNQLRDGAKISLRDAIPNQIADKVVPTMEVNPKLFRRINVVEAAGRSAASSVAVYTTPVGKDFFLVSYQVAFIKDVTNDHATGGVNLMTAVINGRTINLASAAIITLTAQNGIITVQPNIPIKIDQNTAITLGAVTIGAGVFVRQCNIQGYLVDNPNA